MDATGTLSINESGPYHYGDIITFTVTDLHGLHGAHPMVEVAMYQDTNNDGVVDENLYSTDLVFLTLNSPDQAVVLTLNSPDPSKGKARLLAYGWKSKQEYVTPLDSVDFDVEV